MDCAAARLPPKLSPSAARPRALAPPQAAEAVHPTKGYVANHRNPRRKRGSREHNRPGLRCKGCRCHTRPTLPPGRQPGGRGIFGYRIVAKTNLRKKAATPIVGDGGTIVDRRQELSTKLLNAVIIQLTFQTHDHRRGILLSDKTSLPQAYRLKPKPRKWQPAITK